MKLTADGDRLRYRAPRGTLGPADLDALREHKLSVLVALLEDSTEALAEAPVIETRQEQEPGAVLIESPKFGPVWVVLDACLLDEIRSEEQAREDPRPVLRSADIAKLRGKSEAAARAALRVFQMFSGARLMQ